MIPTSSTRKKIPKKTPKDREMRRRKPERGLRRRVQVRKGMSRENDKITEQCMENEKSLATIFEKTLALAPSTK